MYCTQCGTKIEDGYKFCPGCGAPVVQGAPADNRSELDRIADEIFWKDPRFTWAKVLEIQKRTGVDKETAKRMINDRIKDVKRGVDKRICPACGSKDIVVHRMPGTTTTMSFSEGIYHTQYNSGKVRGECLNCGNKWKIKLI